MEYFTEEDQWKDHGSDGKQHQEILFMSSEYKRMEKLGQDWDMWRANYCRCLGPMRTFALLKKQEKEEEEKNDDDDYDEEE